VVGIILAPVLVFLLDSGTDLYTVLGRHRHAKGFRPQAQCAPALSMRDGTSKSPSRPRYRRNVSGSRYARPASAALRSSAPFGAPRSPTLALRRGQVCGRKRHAPHAYLVLRAIASLSLARSVGVSQATLARIEKGEQNATIKTLQQICKALRCDVSELFRRK
jgi:DNA-binding Xre family transcriptional regulator